jgi:hypothetical protein
MKYLCRWMIVFMIVASDKRYTKGIRTHHIRNQRLKHHPNQTKESSYYVGWWKYIWHDQ